MASVVVHEVLAGAGTNHPAAEKKDRTASPRGATEEEDPNSAPAASADELPWVLCPPKPRIMAAPTKHEEEMHRRTGKDVVVLF